jgi:hypothetical protein
VDVVLWPFEAGKGFARWAYLQKDARNKARQTKKPQAFSHCGHRVKKLFGFEIATAAPAFQD